MAEISIQITGLKELQRNFRRAPQLGLQTFQKALVASLFAIDKNANDSNFQFKTPRVDRTGHLKLSWALPGSRKVQGLTARIGPTAEYAPYVQLGTSRQMPNPFMERIALASEKEVNRLMNEAAKSFAQQITKI